jgi:hypothetical protein
MWRYFMSYGTNAPQGFRVYVTSSSSTLNGALSNYSILDNYATSIFSGDPVALLATGGIGIGVAGAAVIGIFQGVIYTDLNNVTQWSPYWSANTRTFQGRPASAFVVDDPNVEFSIQSSTTVNLADLNANANFAIGAGNTRGGLSTTYLDMATLATGNAALNCKLLRLEDDPRNGYGVAFNNVIVTLNNHSLKPGTVGV